MAATARPPVAVGPGHPVSAEGRTSTVRITDAPRPEAATLVAVGDFEGPLALLLRLIEQRELDVLSVPLGDLAGAYLEALAGLPGERMPHISSFLAVASQLILIKSRAMLPEPPVQISADESELIDPAQELRQRLIEYRTFRDAAARLGGLLGAERALFRREAGAPQASAFAGAVAAPAPPLEPRLLVEALTDLARIAPPPLLPAETMRRTVTLAERAAIIRAALAQAPVVVLQELLRDVRDRVVVAVTFLAMLELNKRRELEIEQDRPWGPIVCRGPGTSRPDAGQATSGEAP